jgi:catechol 2,3-dioxygenase-like lactoylglutathione lyase family enzyme
MTQPISISFSHVGIYVTDIDKMVDFYTRFLGFVVSDRGATVSGGRITFLTRDSNEHHQLVMATGRPADLPFNVVNQISFRVDSLRTLKQMHAALKNEPVKDLGPISHGNALSVYFLDPEGNRIELLIDTPWYVPQPMRIPLDLSLPDAELWSAVEEQARTIPGFKPRAEWQAEMEQKLARARTA